MRRRRARARALAALALAASTAAVIAGCSSTPVAHVAKSAASPAAPATASATTAPSAKASAPAAPKVLLSLSGSGIENSPPFLVTESQLTVHYTYDCSGQGGDGNFIADLLNGNQSSPGSDDQSIANALGVGGSATTTIYPTNAGSDYHLAVNSECNWTVVVSTGPIATAPAATPGGKPGGGWAVISAFYSDITKKDYAAAWALLGYDPDGASYASFVAGYADTGTQTVTEVSESGDQVSFNLTSNNPDGTVQAYSGTDTVQNGRIVAASVVQTG
jgi:hypothetical protein